MYWLVKSEPGAWSWQDQKACDDASWDGVRNFQARNHLKAMNVGDLALFYHSVKEKRIMGYVKVTRPYYPDPSDASGRFGMVDVAFEKDFPHPVTLEAIKNHPGLVHLPLLKQSRLSVMPIDPDSWKILCAMGGL